MRLKDYDERDWIAHGIMLVGAALAVGAYWMYLKAGGTLIQQPPSKLYLAPLAAGAALQLYGWHYR